MKKLIVRLTNLIVVYGRLYKFVYYNCTLFYLVAVRAGWQCAECRFCQVCRQPEDDSRLLLCEVCDKAYHSYCIRPAVATVPKLGWKCMVSLS